MAELRRYLAMEAILVEMEPPQDASAWVGSLLMSDLNDMSARRSVTLVVVDEEGEAGEAWPLLEHERKMMMASKRSSWSWVSRPRSTMAYI
uniref:Uncharacterized protein n=1 Tax=Oryza meridionalis TaxID=40149 RepID=A0A0E0CHX0_9ORYZ